jgi:hypothetical protein
MISVRFSGPGARAGDLRLASWCIISPPRVVHSPVAARPTSRIIGATPSRTARSCRLPSRPDHRTVFRRTRVTLGLMTAARLLSAFEPLIRYSPQAPSWSAAFPAVRQYGGIQRLAERPGIPVCSSRWRGKRALPRDQFVEHRHGRECHLRGRQLGSRKSLVDMGREGQCVVSCVSGRHTRLRVQLRPTGHTERPPPQSTFGSNIGVGQVDAHNTSLLQSEPSGSIRPSGVGSM